MIYGIMYIKIKYQGGNKDGIRCANSYNSYR